MTENANNKIPEYAREYKREYQIVFNLNKIENKLINIDQYLDFILNCYHEEDLIFINPYPGFIDFIIILIYFLQN